MGTRSVVVALAASWLLAASANSQMEVRRALHTPDAWRFVGGDWSVGEGRAVQANPGAIAYAFYQALALSDTWVQVRFRVGDEGGGVHEGEPPPPLRPQ